jgi:bacterioferritin
MASGMFADTVKAEFLEHAQQEHEHANKIAERIVQLGGEPDLNPDTLTQRAHAEYKPGNDLRDMVKENLIAERIAIDSYREMINYIGDRDTTTKRILEHVLAQEEEHADDMKDLLDGWIGK